MYMYMYLFLWMEDQKLMGNDPFWALVAEDNNVETLKEAVKAQEQIETEEWFEDILFQYHVAKGFEWV